MGDMPNRRRAGVLVAAVIVAAAWSRASAQDRPKPPPRDVDSAGPGTLVVRCRVAEPSVASSSDDDRVEAADEPEIRVVPDDRRRVEVRTRRVRRPRERSARFTVQGLGESGGWVELNPPYSAARSAPGPLLLFRDPLAGDVDLGEVHLGESAPVLVAGRVLDGAGDPVDSADVQVRVVRPAAAAVAPRVLSVATDADGRFTMRGEVRGDVRLEVHATHGELASGALALPQRTPAVDLVLSETSLVHGTLALPDGVDVADLDMAIRRPLVGREAVWVRGVRLGRRSRQEELLVVPANSPFVVGALVPGHYAFELRFAGSELPLARRETDVRGATSELPPLEVTDLREVEIRLRGPGDVLPRGGRVWVRTKGDAGSFRSRLVGADRRARFAVSGKATEVVARAEGMAFAEVVTPSAEVELRLVPAVSTPVRIELPAGFVRATPKDAESGVERAVVLRWIGAPELLRGDVEGVRSADVDPRGNERLEVAIPAAGPAIASLEVPGWYFVGYQVVMRRAFMRTSTNVGAPLLVDGSGSPVAQSIGISVEDLNRAGEE